MPKLFSETPISITKDNLSDIKSKYINYQKVSFICEECGELATKSLKLISDSLTCRKCAIKKTATEKYGSIEEMQRMNLEHGKATKKSLYGDENFNNREKAIQTSKERFGEHNYNNREKNKTTLKEKYGVENISQLDSVKQKVRETKLEKYGNTNNYEQMKATCLEKYGVENPCFLRRTYIFDSQQFDSSWELYLYIFCRDFNIQLERNTADYFEYANGLKYYPDFKCGSVYIEVKGNHFFENGKMICPFDRSFDSIFQAKYECMLEHNVLVLTSTELDSVFDYVNSKYTSDFVQLFKSGLPFPYPNEDLHDTSSMGIIRHFHKSIFEAHKAGQLSPLEAWNMKMNFESLALNRLHYVGRCTPNDIVSAFSITKTNEKVSVFHPSLAEQLIKKYATTDTIFDPFSGFSGRMLGAVRANKSYIGQDINQKHVDESNQIIEYLKLNDCSVSKIDILADSAKQLNCTLFTCPPYSGKEQWNENETFKSCDEWIEICLEKYKCSEYIFVVDTTSKFTNHIVETLTNKSHFGTNHEYVLLFK